MHVPTGYLKNLSCKGKIKLRRSFFKNNLTSYIRIRINELSNTSKFTTTFSFLTLKRKTSAPRDFVISISNNSFSSSYDVDGPLKQTFEFSPFGLEKSDIVEIEILSNWGHPKVACIYKIEIHWPCPSSIRTWFFKDFFLEKLAKMAVVHDLVVGPNKGHKVTKNVQATVL